MKRIDVLVVGAGIIGINVARSILIQDPGLKVTVIDKEPSIGFHASSRNSGVLHSGFYYNSGSLKSRFCVQGNIEWEDLLVKNSLPYRKTGKLIVAKNQADVDQLFHLYENGLSQGVNIELLPSKYLSKYDELAETYKYFIWSPSTAISDPITAMNFLAKDLLNLGGEILTNSVLEVLPDNCLSINGKSIFYKHLVNCAGASADKIAHKFGVGLNYSLIPFMGSYLVTRQQDLPVKRLIYPLPQPGNAFLGVHLTPTTNGMVKLGPTAFPTFGSEYYGLGSDFNWSDLSKSSKGLFNYAKANINEFGSLAISELKKKNRSHLLNEAQHLVKANLRLMKWEKSKPGIRAQLVDKTTGKLESDFKILSAAGSTHLLNVVSPGWTSALPFSRDIALAVLKDLHSS